MAKRQIEVKLDVTILPNLEQRKTQACLDEIRKREKLQKQELSEERYTVETA